MKLVFVFYQFYPNIGGTEIPMLHYAKELVSRGHDVIVCTANCRDMKPAKLPGEEVIDGITVKRFKYLPLPLPYFFFTPGIIPYLWKSKSDAVQVFAVLPSFMLFAACAVTKLTGKRLVLYPQSYPNRFGYFTSRWKRVAGNLFDKTIARLFLKMADHVIALTDAEANVYRQMGLKVTRIYEGISLDDAPPEQKVDDFRTKLNIQRDEPVLLAIGRLEERKGIDVLISAMPAILANFPTARLVIVGKGKNQTNYENLATNLKCRDRVMFLHSLSDEELACLYEMARVVVVPSYFEAYGRIPVEGWAHRKPVVVSTGVGISEAVTPDRGILVNYGDKVGLAEAILKLLRDRSLAQSMGANGYQFVMGELGWRQQAARMEEVCGAGPQP